MRPGIAENAVAAHSSFFMTFILIHRAEELNRLLPLYRLDFTGTGKQSRACLEANVLDDYAWFWYPLLFGSFVQNKLYIHYRCRHENLETGPQFFVPGRPAVVIL